MQKQNDFLLHTLHIILIAAVFSIAVLLRAYNIDNVPSGIYPDEAVNATDALHALETGQYKLFYENNQGREGLFINLQAFAFKIFGPTIFALKFWSIVFGSFTVIGIYLLAQEIWHKRFASLASAYLAAVSFWAINFSRIGFRAIMVPFLLSFAFYFFLRGLRTKHLSSFALSGFIFALGIHTYIAFRLAPLILIIFLIGLVLSYKDFFKTYWKHAIVFTIFAFIAATPMFWDFYQHPEHFGSRSTHISIFSSEINHGNFWGTFSKTLSLSMIKYNLVGDQNWRHNYPPYPILDPLSGVAFLVGFVYVISRTISLLIRRFRDNDRNRELAINLLLIGWFFTMSMPEFLTDEGLPHALRSIGTQPVVFLLMTIPFIRIGEILKTSKPVENIMILSFLIITLTSIGVFNTLKYHVFYAENPKQHDSFNANYKNMSWYLLSLPDETKKYVYVNSGGILPENNLPIAAQPIAFLTYHKIQNLSFILPKHEIGDRGNTLSLQPHSKIILMNNDNDFTTYIKDIYPEASMETIDLFPGHNSSFTAITLP